MSERVFKLGDGPIAGKDVDDWREFLHDRFRGWHIDYPLEMTGPYDQELRAATATFMRAWGVENVGEAMSEGLTPWWRTKLRDDRRTSIQRDLFESAERKDYRAALRDKYNGGGVAMPVAKILADSNDWAGPAHDGIDLICLPEAPLHAICKAKVIRADNSGWWGKGAVASGGHPVSDGDGIVIIQSLVDVGPISKGDCFGYGHAEKMRVKPGDVVEAGEWIANAGFARAWHPHWMRNTGGFPAAIGRGDKDPRPVLDYLKEHA